MTHEYTDDECYKCMEYTQFITDAQTWACEVCHLVEIGIKDPVDSRYDIIWGRYQLACTHQAHLRCLRTWCKIQGFVGCPVCGPIDEIESNTFCNHCNTFGHSTKLCIVDRTNGYRS
jgi:hypothetical protein